MSQLVFDLRDALRALRAAPRFSIAALALLSISIGATASAFGLVDAALVRALPFESSDRLVWVWATRTDRDKAFFSIPNFTDTRERCVGFEGLAAFANWGATLAGDGDPERVQGVRITPEAFALLGVRAAVGRTLGPEDAQNDAGRVVVLGDGLWRRRFGADPAVVGRTVLLNDDAYTVVGVLPPAFFFVGADAELAIPLRLDTDPRRTERGSNFLRVYGRLRPGVTAADVAGELAAATAELRDAFPEPNAKLTDPRVVPLRDEVAGAYRATLLLVLGVAAIVLLVACANLSSLALVRSIDRRREIAVRVALGAPSGRVARLLALESLLLAIGGALGGLAIARAAIPAAAGAAFADLPLLRGATLDVRALLFTLVVTSGVALLVGLLPARVARRIDLGDMLRTGGRYGSTGRTAGRTRDALAAAEIAATVVLIVGAGLLAKSLVRLAEVRPGFDTHDLIFARVSLPPAAYTTPEAVGAYADRVVLTLDRYAGVRAASVASALPLSGVNNRTDFRIAGRDPASRAEMPGAQNRWVTPGYFAVMRIPLVDGRGLDERDRSDTAAAVVVDEALARRFFGDASPVGAHLFLEDTAAGPREVEVVGVVGAVTHFSLDEEPLPTIYAPLAQAPAQNLSFLVGSLTVVARTEIDPTSVANGFVKELRHVDPNVPITKASTMDETLARSLGPRRMAAAVAAGFAPVALALAIFGLYAVVAYAVSRRTRELAIRIALGASPARIVATLARPALAITVAGVTGGIAAALGLARMAESLLYRVSPADPWVFAGAAVATAVVALAAGFVPARRAARVDPTIAMRAE